MQNYYIIIDDQSPNVTRVGTWELNGGSQQEYNGTTSSSYSIGAKLEVSFYGTSIQAYGTLSPGASSRTSFLVDGDGDNGGDDSDDDDNDNGDGQSNPFVWKGQGNSDHYNSQLFSQRGLAVTEPHTLSVIINETSSSTSADVFFDYFLVTVPFNSTDTDILAGQTIIIDDSSPQVDYSDGDNGSWNHGSGDAYFNNSYHTAEDDGSTATVAVAVPGKGGSDIIVCGAFIEGDSGAVQFALDGGSPTTYSMPSASSSVNQSSTPVYKASNISQGSHTLVITGLGGHFAFDYVTISPSGLVVKAPSSTSSTGGARSSSPASPSSPLISSSASSSSKSNVGAIVGGLFGAIIVLALAAVFTVVLNKHRQARSRRRQLALDIDGPFFTPYLRGNVSGRQKKLKDTETSCLQTPKPVTPLSPIARFEGSPNGHQARAVPPPLRVEPNYVPLISITSPVSPTSTRRSPRERIDLLPSPWSSPTDSIPERLPSPPPVILDSSLPLPRPLSESFSDSRNSNWSVAAAASTAASSSGAHKLTGGFSRAAVGDLRAEQPPPEYSPI